VRARDSCLPLLFLGLLAFSGGCHESTGRADGPTRDGGGAGDGASSSEDALGADSGTPVEPGAGELGGACLSGGQCSQGSCESLPGGRGERCTTSCDDNRVCPANLRCEAVSADEMRCLFGPRGSGLVGEPCGPGQKGLGCASGLCVDASQDEAIPEDTCTAHCQGDEGCAVPFPVCVSLVDLCFPIVSGDLGGLCEQGGACVEGGCTEVDGLGERCTLACTPGDDCGRPYLECRAAGGTHLCLMKLSSS
jgi:hypothetical protein